MSSLGDELAEGEPKLAPGTVIGEYEVQGLLGEGGFGSVYRAVHPVIGKSAAVKVLKREYSAKPEMVARFVSEARAVNQIRHRNIIDIFSFGKLEDGRQFFVMELLEGSPLDDYIQQQGKLSVQHALPILRQLARALGAAHAAGITHRDIKPENVFLTFDEDRHPVPKLLDFGIAKLMVDNLSQHKTRSGVPMGTPLFMSPEQVHGRDVDSRSDIYSFGIMVFQLLTGAVPFTGESMMSVMMKQVSEPPPRPSSVNPELPVELDAPILHMLEKEPDRRPATILEAVDAMARAVQAAGLTGFTPASLEPLPLPSAKPSSGGVRLMAQTPAKPPSDATIAAFGASDTLIASETPSFAQPSTAPRAEPPRRSPIVFVGAAALVLGIVGAAVVLTTRSASTSPAASSSSSPTVTTNAASSAPATSASQGPLVSPATSAVASAVTPSKTITLRLKSQPEGVEVWEGTKKLGLTGEDLEFPRGDAEIKLTLKKAGYQPMPYPFTPNDNVIDAVILKVAAKAPAEYGPF